VRELQGRLLHDTASPHTHARAHAQRLHLELTRAHVKLSEVDRLIRVRITICFQLPRCDVSNVDILQSNLCVWAFVDDLGLDSVIELVLACSHYADQDSNTSGVPATQK
jgi:hypothetical protein